MADEKAFPRDQASDGSVLQHIRELIVEEQRLYEHTALTDAEETRLRQVAVELDQYWDLLRQRRALREFGRDPSEAHLRPPEVVEKYKG